MKKEKKTSNIIFIVKKVQEFFGFFVYLYALLLNTFVLMLRKVTGFFVRIIFVISGFLKKFLTNVGLLRIYSATEESVSLLSKFRDFFLARSTFLRKNLFNYIRYRHLAREFWKGLYKKSVNFKVVVHYFEKRQADYNFANSFAGKFFYQFLFHFKLFLKARFDEGWFFLNYIFLSLPYSLFIYIFILPFCLFAVLTYPFIYFFSELLQRKSLILTILNFSAVWIRLFLFICLSVLKNIYELSTLFSTQFFINAVNYFFGTFFYPLLPVFLLPLFFYIIIWCILQDFSINSFWSFFRLFMGSVEEMNVEFNLYDFFDARLVVMVFLFIFPYIYAHIPVPIGWDLVSTSFYTSRAFEYKDANLFYKDYRFPAFSKYNDYISMLFFELNEIVLTLLFYV